jgi:hypothetical protein
MYNFLLLCEYEKKKKEVRIDIQKIVAVLGRDNEDVTITFIRPTQALERQSLQTTATAAVCTLPEEI